MDVGLGSWHPAADYWVGPKGRDARGQGSRTRPAATLQFVADRVRPGDTVHVLDGDYAGVDVRHGGTRGAPIVFKAEGKRAGSCGGTPRLPTESILRVPTTSS